MDIPPTAQCAHLQQATDLKLACGQREKEGLSSEITRQNDRDLFPPIFGHSVETDLHKE